jgi:LPS-assembly lipoprotein
MERPGIRPFGRRLALLGLLALAGCGWQPLYGRSSATGAGGNAGPELAQVHIQPIADRVGQNLYNMLRDRMNPQGVPADPRYDLVIKLRETNTQQLIQQDQTASRINSTLNAEFQLFRRGQQGAIMTGQSRATTTYDLISTDPYASTVSANDAKRRAAQSLADDISNRLAVYLAHPTGS